MDGTLAKSLPLMYRTYLDFLSGFGIEGTQREFEELNGPSMLEITRILQERHRLPGSADDLLKRYLALIADRYARLARPNEGARELLEWARKAGLRMALVTSAYENIARGFLAANSLSDFFEAIVTGEDVAVSKPDPAIYLATLRKLGVAAEEAVVVEDSIHGVASSMEAGIRTILMDPAGKWAGLAMPRLMGRVSRLDEAISLIERSLDAQ